LTPESPRWERFIAMLESANQNKSVSEYLADIVAQATAKAA
jgi:hypothetical protein